MLRNKIARRTLSIFSVGSVCALLTLAFPLVFLACALLDIKAKPTWAYIRAICFIEGFLIMELLGITIGFLIWVAEMLRWDEERFQARNYRLQNWWGVTIAKIAIRLYGITLEIKNPFEPTNRPFILFIRHASFVDTFLPILLVSSKHNIRLKYVLKEELLWDPCLDIVGNRIPNVFVKRGSNNSLAQIEKIQKLAENLNEDEGVVVYPEGTRFTQSKKERILGRAKQAGTESFDRASRFQNVLPPHLGGTLALLEGAPTADAVFCSHYGLESTVSLRQLLAGDLVGTKIRVHFHTASNESIPTNHDERKTWFMEQWLNVDSIVTGYINDKPKTVQD
jgi:1-acyl-sn-glycerol-3-phosphate acyltransferase